MKATKLRPSTTKEGWSVHVYDQERRLRCTIEPSHCWALGLGLALGVFITLGITSLDVSGRFQTLPEKTSESGASSGQSSEQNNEFTAPIQVD